ncbi:hypothetical protein [Cryptosporangium japonicum]|uniref:Uncharacterized protein n=1 Tax=Cryptosporangium japonicum TaxID=80872 RepID=A0ABN0TJZ6_9ACTN
MTTSSWGDRVTPLRLVCGLFRGLGALIPDDPYTVWTGPGGPITITPLFLPYDSQFQPFSVLPRPDASPLQRRPDDGEEWSS